MVSMQVCHDQWGREGKTRPHALQSTNKNILQATQQCYFVGVNYMAPSLLQ